MTVGCPVTADVTAALVHAFGLFIAHTYDTLTMFSERRSRNANFYSWESLIWAVSEVTQ